MLLSVLITISICISYAFAQNMTLHMLNSTMYPEAQCVDGSPAGFYHLQGSGEGSDKYIIFMEGGGACLGPTKGAVLASCYERSFTKLGSSKNWSQEKNPIGVLQTSQKENPQFYNWNKIFIPYCTGMIHQGYKAEPEKYLGKNLYFKGVNVTYDIFDQLVKNFNISSSDISEVLLTGTSAGGLGTYTFADYVKSLLHPNTKFWAAPDSGFFINYYYDDPQNFLVKCFNSALDIIDKSEILPKNCPYIHDPELNYKCILPEGYAQNISSDLYIIESEYDEFTIDVFVGIECTHHGSMQKCSQDQQQTLQNFRLQTIGKVKHILEQKPNANAWLVSCVKHGFFNSNSAYNEQIYQVPQHTGFTPNVALYQWMYQTPELRNNHIDNVKWPQNQQCNGLDTEVEQIFQY